MTFSEHVDTLPNTRHFKTRILQMLGDIGHLELRGVIISNIKLEDLQPFHFRSFSKQRNVGERTLKWVMLHDKRLRSLIDTTFPEPVRKPRKSPCTLCKGTGEVVVHTKLPKALLRLDN